jgi:tetratricopeptide (TPR) repeat protein
MSVLPAHRPLVIALTMAGAIGAAGASAAAGPPPSSGLAAVQSQLRSGQYEKARKGADGLGRRKGGDARAAVLGARAERALGLLAEARRRLERAGLDAPDDLPLRAELAELLDAVGDRGAVKDLVNRSYDDWEAGRVDRRDPLELLAMSSIARLDNNWEDANSALRTALRQVGGGPARAKLGADVNLAWGELFLEKHAADNAVRCFREVLAADPKHPDAQVGLARALLEQGYDGQAALKLLVAALAVNPRHPGALALRAEIALDAEDWPAVATGIAALRRTNPHDPAAAWLSASLARLRDDRGGYEAERDRRLEVRPADGDFFAQTAEALVRHRRYDDARDVAADGVEREGTHARLLASLGNTLLRLGEEDAGLAMLRRAWDRDPYDVRTYNLLNLFEKVIPERYVTIATRSLRFRIERDQRPVIEGIVAPFLERAFESYVTRYGYRPPAPVVFELYGAPEHYAVRTVGLPRLGLAGVCFGRVITSQAPANAAFNWGMVLAHELAHVFSLQPSRSRVPRWFTEGLAELETARLRPDWRRQADVDLAAALEAGQLPGLAGLSPAFVRAKDGHDAALAYMHAAAAVEFLERTFGFERLRGALTAWGSGAGDTPVLEQLSRMPLSRLDETFRADLDKRLGPLRARLGGYERARRAGLDAVRAGDRQAALKQLRAAVEAAPSSVEARALLAEHLAALGDDEARLAMETEILRLEPQSATLAKRVVLGHARAGHVDQTAELAAAALFIDPDDSDLHAALGRALAAQGKNREAAAALERALQFGIADPAPIHRALVTVYEKLGEPARAANHRTGARAP